MIYKVQQRATTPVLKELGEALKRARISANFTQEKAAEMAGVSLQTVSNWETGRYQPTQMHFERLAALYGRTADSITIEALRAAGESTDKLFESGVYKRIPNVHSPSRAKEIPVVGYVSAGKAREAWEIDLGTVPIPENVIQEAPRAFALIINGNSLEGDAIRDGDLVVVDPDASYLVDKIYIVRNSDGEVTAKHLELSPEGEMVLRASNHGYQSIRVTNGHVLGRVIWHLRRM